MGLNKSWSVLSKAMSNSTVTIDASGKILGRLAAKIALTLRGKHLPTFRPERESDVTVHVTNVNKIRVSGNKLDQKIYYHFSGYPGGLKEENLRKKMERQPDQVLRLAVRRMLPDNRMRAKMMKRLLID